MLTQHVTLSSNSAGVHSTQRQYTSKYSTQHLTLQVTWSAGIRCHSEGKFQKTLLSTSAPNIYIKQWAQQLQHWPLHVVDIYQHINSSPPATYSAALHRQPQIQCIPAVQSYLSQDANRTTRLMCIFWVPGGHSIVLPLCIPRQPHHIQQVVTMLQADMQLALVCEMHIIQMKRVSCKKGHSTYISKHTPQHRSSSAGPDSTTDTRWWCTAFIVMDGNTTTHSTYSCNN